MSKDLFDVENKVWMFLNKLTDLFLLSVLGFIFSLPIATAGAATAGFCYGVICIFDKTDTSIWRDFISGFKNSFKTATIVWLIQIFVFAILAMNMWVSFKMNTPVGWFVLGINMVLFVSIFIYPVIARYNFAIKEILYDSYLNIEWIEIGYIYT